MNEREHQMFTEIVVAADPDELGRLVEILKRINEVERRAFAILGPIVESREFPTEEELAAGEAAILQALVSNRELSAFLASREDPGAGGGGSN